MLGLVSALRLPSQSDLQNHGDHVEIRGAVQSSWELLQYGKNAWLRLCYSIGMIAFSTGLDRSVTSSDVTPSSEHTNA